MLNPQITQDDIIYFVVTDRFFGQNKRSVSPSDKTMHGGTLDGILQKLDYLTHLGVTALWITPVYRNISNHDGDEPYHYYWPENFEGIDPRLIDGSSLDKPPTDPITMSILNDFTERCADHGVKVVLDTVVNHAGYGAQTHFNPSWFNPPIDTDDEVKQWLSGLPDFNHDNPEVVNYFTKNLKSWICRGGIHGIRMDTAKHVEKKFWHYFRSLVRGPHPEIFMVGEVLLESKNDIQTLEGYQNYHDFDSVFDFPLGKALRSTLIDDESLSYWLASPRLTEKIDKNEYGVLDYDNPSEGGYRRPNQLVTLLDNHDLPRRLMSHARSKHPGDSGRAYAFHTAKLCLAALFTMRGIPQIYYGTEIGLEGWNQDGNDCDLRRDFPWEMIDPVTQEPFDKYALEYDLYTYLRELIALRRHNPALIYGNTITMWVDDFVYSYLRVSEDEVAFCILNNGYDNMSVPIAIPLSNSNIPEWVRQRLATQMKPRLHEIPLSVVDDHMMVKAPGKTLLIYTE